MIKHDLIRKGGIGHALLSSGSYPNILIPAKVVIKDVKFDESNPQYLVKIIYFYDTVFFLKNYFMNMSFKTGLDSRKRKLEFSSSFKPKTTEEILDYIHTNEKQFYVVVDSISCVPTKAEMNTRFNKIQDYLIERDFNSIKGKSVRSFYSGKYKVPTKNEFFARLKRMISDMVAKTDSDWNNFIERF